MIPKPLHEYQKQMNLRWIEPNEIVFDVDNRDIGFLAINAIAYSLNKDGYAFEIYYAKGQKSPHLHLWFEKELDNNFKMNFCLLHCPSKYHEWLDVSFYEKENSLIAEENKTHFKYNEKKKLLLEVNNGQFQLNEIKNIPQQNMLTSPVKINNVKLNKQIGNITKQVASKLSIINVARSFGLSLHGNKAVCPFHADANPSLGLDDANGVFHCFGCNAKGNLVDFVKLCRKSKLKRDVDIKWERT
jgi:hypothetical protein